MCDSESVRDEAKNRAAIERRMWALENEFLQRSLLVEKIVRELDTLYGASRGLSVPALQILARNEAMAISERRGGQPPPPMPAFVNSELTSRSARDMQAFVTQAIADSIVDNDDTFSEDTVRGMADAADKKPVEGGWDWMPNRDDDFMDYKDVEVYHAKLMNVVESDGPDQGEEDGEVDRSGGVEALVLEGPVGSSDSSSSGKKNLRAATGRDESKTPVQGWNDEHGLGEPGA
ncbi:unnamed protein product, partial [Discosporangium mesarthrocarpum]